MKQQKQRVFGVGCFHFGYRQQVPFQFRTERYIEALSAALKSLPSVNKLSIDHDENLKQEYHVESATATLNSGEGYFPVVSFLRINLSIYIPFRVQEEVLESTGGGSIGTENFSILMLETYYGPVTFIECLNAPVECSPTDAVRLLRMYLKREFKKIEGPITFEYLGPSPFHADFLLRGNPQFDGEFSSQIMPRRGYDQVIFECGTEGLPSDDDLESLYDELDGEVGLFYSIQGRNVAFMKRWSSLVKEWERLRELVEKKVRVINITHRIEIHRASKQLISDAYSFGAELDIARQDREQEMTNEYDKGTPIYLDKFVRRKAEMLPQYPVATVLGWAQHVNEASFKQAEIVAVIFAGLIGGVVGSLVTASMGSGV
ncbi:MAG TPA: hypothetical protein VN283_00600 [Thiobacillus sp.]|nr:hypothetical protein [Thiobacillus sp.]